jgi:uncharacterized protein (DUF1499 family)
MRGTFGLIAAATMALGPLLAWLQVVPALAGFVLYALGGLAATIAGLAAAVRLLRRRPLGRSGAVAMGAGLLFALIAARGAGAPRINDFTTDLADPPAFRKAATLPANAGRNLDYPARFADIQRQCCADLRPAKLALAGSEALRRVRNVAEGLPAWQVTAADEQAGTLEAVATSRLFGFQDDVVVRVRAQPDGTSRVDVRSKSRDGQGDLGANAARIRGFVAALEAAR